ncbi:hypothetical protein BS055_RS22920 [Vibrio parahaemolyticus]|nr:hypothetical protein [Vibrio cholerae]EGR1976112.1 hypothetical protein [Vibrio parahaemolyticus]EJG0875496.1 hypothetical protein [Vibrio parahaemolyticus O3]EJG0904126.1 hypothetical protein [Vibrio parahaemolyticus O3:K56]EJG1076955.1 hypothetical protein [Vibrio parahaemolyticus O1:K56]RBM24521.1 hypothetical protein DLR59_19140 [Vibrio tarriae]RBM74090.1 hypothetical protein DLR68_15220 [Vibrio paracholerae]
MALDVCLFDSFA